MKCPFGTRVYTLIGFEIKALHGQKAESGGGGDALFDGSDSWPVGPTLSCMSERTREYIKHSDS